MSESDIDVDEDGKVVAWRAQVLVWAGFPPEDAFCLAERPDVDVHAATDLLARGCPVQTAIEILI